MAGLEQRLAERLDASAVERLRQGFPKRQPSGDPRPLVPPPTQP
jgi:hypothetical protein